MRLLAISLLSPFLLLTFPGAGAAQSDSLVLVWHTVLETEGARLTVDSAMVGPLEEDSTFFVRTGSFLAPTVQLSDGSRIDREIDLQHVDCRRPRVRGLVAQLLSGETLVEVRTLSDRWEDLPAERQPGWQAVCSFALQGYTPRTPPRDDHGPEVREDQPWLTNGAAAVAAVRREYPRELRARRIAGEASVRLRVRADGSVDRNRIDVYSATPGFAEAARRVAAVLRFHPARVGGQAVPVWVSFPVSFRPF
jgi:TonB family protein